MYTIYILTTCKIHNHPFLYPNSQETLEQGNRAGRSGASVIWLDGVSYLVFGAWFRYIMEWWLHLGSMDWSSYNKAHNVCTVNAEFLRFLTIIWLKDWEVLCKIQGMHTNLLVSAHNVQAALWSEESGQCHLIAICRLLSDSLPIMPGRGQCSEEIHSCLQVACRLSHNCP